MTYIPAVTGIVDTNNSSTTPLTSGSTFTGTATEVLLYSEIVINASSDQSSATNGFSFQFSSDGTNWDTTDSITFSPTNIVRTTPVLARYFRIVFTNGTINQTFFRLQTILHPQKNMNDNYNINETINYNTAQAPLNRSFLVAPVRVSNYCQEIYANPNGFLDVSLKDPTSAFGDLRMQIPTPVSQVEFTYGLNPYLCITGGTGSGTVTASTGTTSFVTVSTTAATNSGASLRTTRYFKYRPGQGGLHRFTALFSTGATGSLQISGPGTDNNGYFFGYTGPSFGILYRTSTSGSPVDTWIPQTSWNIDRMDGTNGILNKSGITLDPQKGNVYQITTTYLGFGNIYFYIMSPETGFFTLVHILKYPNQNTVSLVANASFPLYWYVLNTTNNTNIALSTASGAQFVEGNIQELGPQFGISSPLLSGNISRSPLTPTPFLHVRVDTTFKGVTNLAQVWLRSVSFSYSSNATTTTQFFVLLNSSFATPESAYSPVNINSCVSYATGGTLNTLTSTGSPIIFNSCCNSVSRDTIDLAPYNIYLNPGDKITFAGSTSSGNVVGIAATNWAEQI